MGDRQTDHCNQSVTNNCDPKYFSGSRGCSKYIRLQFCHRDVVLTVVTVTDTVTDTGRTVDSTEVLTVSVF